MPVREKAPIGAPCWTDVWTSDVDGARKFYSELFGWNAEEPSEEFGGYFMFTLDGVPVSGGMGNMGGMTANNTWSIYLTTDDCEKTVAAATEAGATIQAPPMPVADLGVQAIFDDPTGAHLGMWQPLSFHGFSVLDEPSTASWFELHTRDYEGALKFYQSVFHWETTVVGDSDQFRYSAVKNPDGGNELAGVMDASSFLAEGQGSYWTVYWNCEDVDQTIAKLKELGGSVVAEAQATPYGKIATVADPFGAQFRLRTPPQ